MGGFGSGRKGGLPTVESGLTLDVSRLLRQGSIIPGKHVSGSMSWTIVRTGKRVGRIGYEANMLDPSESWLRLMYTSTQRSDGSKVESDYRVRLDTTQPHFGGVRWWFICPLSGRRAAKLHLPNGAHRFASQQAYRLPYDSQREGGMDRTHARQARVVQKLGGEYRFSDPPTPPRPKWMRRKTYERLRAELRAAVEAHEVVFNAGAERIIERGKRSDERRKRSCAP